MASPDKKKKIKGFKEFDPSKYIETKPVLDEAKKGTVVVAWGRMNPMTAGHEKLVNKVISVAKSEKGQPEIYLTHSFDKKKNPLAYDDKIKLAQKAFGPTVKKSNAKTIFQLMAQLNTKYNKVVLVAGSDRVDEFSNTLQKYNGKEYNFDEIKVVSAGSRDPDADDVSGISGTKMRGFAATDMKKFTANLPARLKGDAESIAALVRKGMNMSESEEIHVDDMEVIDEALNRQQRRARSIAFKRARFKIKRGREKAKRKVASMEVLKKRARKAAIGVLKQKFSKNRRYAELTSGEKEIIDKRIEKINKKRIEAIARKLLPKVRTKERERIKAMHSKRNESFEMNEACQTDVKGRKVPHMLLTKEGKVKFDSRFKLYKKKVNESTENLYEDINDLMEATESFAENYYKGVPKNKIDDRKAHFKRHAEKPGDGADKDSNYKPAPGDFKDGKRVKTKLSQHTKNYRAMYGEENEWVCGQCNCDPCVCEGDIHEDATASLKKKSEKTGMPLSVLRKVYNRGVAAWKSGHRPGTTPEQWGHARVNSFVTKSSGTWGKADADLAAKVKKEETMSKTFKELNEDLQKDIQRQKEIQARNKARTATAKSEVEREKVTDKLHKSSLKRSMDRAKHYDARMKLSGLKKEEVELDEVLDTPKAMDSYKAKAKHSKERASNSAAAKILRGKNADGSRADHSPELKTMAKREKGLKMADKNAMKKTFKMLRKEHQELDELSMSVKDITKSGNEKMMRAMKKDKIKKDLEDLRKRLDNTKNEEHGAGDEGTDKLVKKYKKDTPNA